MRKRKTSETIKSLYRAGLVLSLCLSCSLRKFALPQAGSIARAAGIVVQERLDMKSEGIGGCAETFY